MKSHLFYIHGYNSSPQSETVSMLRAVFPKVIALDYDYKTPVESIQTLADEIHKYEGDKIIVGSSLGGWYTEQLTNKVSGGFIFFNPAVEPDKTLSILGVSVDICEKYKNASDYSFRRVAKRNVVIALDDDTIDPMKSIIKYCNHAKIIDTTGGHRMTCHNFPIIVNLITTLDSAIC